MGGGGDYYYDNSKLRSSHQTGSVGKGSDHLQLIKFGPSCAMGTALQLGEIFLVLLYYGQRAECPTPSALLIRLVFGRPILPEITPE